MQYRGSQNKFMNCLLFDWKYMKPLWYHLNENLTVLVSQRLHTKWIKKDWEVTQAISKYHIFTLQITAQKWSQSAYFNPFSANLKNCFYHYGSPSLDFKVQLIDIKERGYNWSKSNCSLSAVKKYQVLKSVCIWR